jgi:hypothetical protein
MIFTDMKWRIEVTEKGEGSPKRVIQANNLLEICHEMAKSSFTKYEILSNIGNPAPWQVLIEKKIAELRNL